MHPEGTLDDKNFHDRVLNDDIQEAFKPYLPNSVRVTLDEITPGLYPRARFVFTSVYQSLHSTSLHIAENRLNDRSYIENIARTASHELAMLVLRDSGFSHFPA